MDGGDDNFLRGIFPIAIFVVIPTLCISFVLRRVFLCFFEYKFSVHIRRYFFISCELLQTLIEPNIAFLTYLLCRQSFLSFSFNFADKISLTVSLLLFFPVLIFACCFYFMFNRQLKKKFGYFIYCFKRCSPSMLYLTLRLILRGLLRGAIHGCLHENYFAEITLLCAMEASVVILTVWIEKTSKIFMNQQMFVLTILYHLMFILLNLTFYVEEITKKEDEGEEIREILLFFQQILLYALLSLVSYEFLIDFIPNEWLNPCNNDEENTEES